MSMTSWGNHNCGKSLWKNIKLFCSVVVYFIESDLDTYRLFLKSLGITCLSAHLVTILFRPLDCTEQLIPLIMKTDNWLFCLLHPHSPTSMATFNKHQAEAQKGQKKKRIGLGGYRRVPDWKGLRGKMNKKPKKKKKGRIHEEKRRCRVQQTRQNLLNDHVLSR